MANLAGSLGLGTHLFVKVPQPGDSEGTFSVFESSADMRFGPFPRYRVKVTQLLA